jgi:hypothetical protein
MAGNPPQPPSRIILANGTRLLREMLKRAIIRSPHLRVVGEFTAETDLTSMVEETHAQWVIVSLLPDGEVPEVADTLLAEHPSVAVLAVAADGSQVRIGWTEPLEKAIALTPDGRPVQLKWTESQDKRLEDLSLDELIAIMRRGSSWEQAVGDLEAGLL